MSPERSASDWRPCRASNALRHCPERSVSQAGVEPRISAPDPGVETRLIQTTALYSLATRSLARTLARLIVLAARKQPVINDCSASADPHAGHELKLLSRLTSRDRPKGRTNRGGARRPRKRLDGSRAGFSWVIHSRGSRSAVFVASFVTLGRFAAACTPRRTPDGTSTRNVQACSRSPAPSVFLLVSRASPSAARRAAEPLVRGCYPVERQ